MEKNKILNADILDIIFDGKNKNYGAYQLRKTYNKRLVKATFFTFVLVVVAFLGTVFSSMAGKNVRDDIEVIDTTLGDVKTVEPPPPLPPPALKPPPPQVVNQVKYVIPRIVVDEDVKPDEKIEEIHDDAMISTKTVESDIKSQIVQAPVDETASEVLEAPKVKDEDKVFVTVENDAKFPGGLEAWKRFLERNLDVYVGVNNGAPAGTYRVIVRFIVSKDGSISDVNAETKHGFGMEDEAVKIIKRGPKWIPALQNGRNVNAYRRQPITFVVEDK